MKSSAVFINPKTGASKRTQVQLLGYNMSSPSITAEKKNVENGRWNRGNFANCTRMIDSQGETTTKMRVLVRGYEDYWELCCYPGGREYPCCCHRPLFFSPRALLVEDTTLVGDLLSSLLPFSLHFLCLDNCVCLVLFIVAAIRGVGARPSYELTAEH